MKVFFRNTNNLKLKILILKYKKDALKNLDIVVNQLKSGSIIAVPTDTIYGLACLACNKESLSKIYSIKGRDSAKLLAICVGNTTDLAKYLK